MAYKKVRVGSVCPVAKNGVHQWTTSESDMRPDKPKLVTWCKECGGIPK